MCVCVHVNKAYQGMYVYMGVVMCISVHVCYTGL